MYNLLLGTITGLIMGFFLGAVFGTFLGLVEEVIGKIAGKMTVETLDRILKNKFTYDSKGAKYRIFKLTPIKEK